MIIPAQVPNAGNPECTASRSGSSTSNVRASLDIVVDSPPGMIMLAERIEGGVPGQETVGGLDVVVRRNAFGRQVDSFEADLDLTGFEDKFHAVFIRAPWVEKVGQDVEVVARVAGVRGGVRPEAVGRIVAVRQGSLLATSFHPEITGDPRIHGLFVDMVRAARQSSDRK